MLTGYLINPNGPANTYIDAIPNYLHIFDNSLEIGFSFGVFRPLAPPLALVGALCALFVGIWSYGNVRMDREIISCFQQTNQFDIVFTIQKLVSEENMNLPLPGYL